MADVKESERPSQPEDGRSDTTSDLSTSAELQVRLARLGARHGARWFLSLHPVSVCPTAFLHGGPGTPAGLPQDPTFDLSREEPWRGSGRRPSRSDNDGDAQSGSHRLRFFPVVVAGLRYHGDGRYGPPEAPQPVPPGPTQQREVPPPDGPALPVLQSPVPTGFLKSLKSF